ncbi:MAG: hypothetical protein GAK45_00802 [Pseudomonas citronellolis]|nr:MAG: hypothetical protein GAK45_00802 [Pseudomonas citronellolis]
MPIRPLLPLLAAAVLLAGCTSELNHEREKRFADTPAKSVEVRPSALSLGLATTPSGQSLTQDSIRALNDLLRRQGRLAGQNLTLIPQSPAGERIAQRLGSVLKERGLPAAQLTLESIRLQPRDSGSRDDLLVISEALVTQIPDCHIDHPESWAIEPYTAMGSLGCANRANLAAMVADPRDLLYPRTLAPGEGNQASNAVQRYQQDDIRELIDIDFDGDD